MLSSHTMFPAILIVLSAICGLFIASYIRYKKTRHKVLVCPIGSTCDTVVHSEYSKFFGIPVELLGIVYYLFIIVSYGSLLFFSDLKIPFLNLFTVITSGAAFLFSAYLTFIQAFTLKQWCTWCLFSATLCTIIFLSAISVSGFAFIPFFIEYKKVIIGAHLLGFAFGLGGATVGDMLFMRFLKDFKISKHESATLHMISQIIWFGIGLIVLSGIALFLTNIDGYLASSKFLLKMIVVTVIIVNGLFLNLYISPKLVQLSFHENQRPHYKAMHRARRIAFALGAVSVTSWYSAFILGLTKSIPLSLRTLVLIYGGLLCVAMLCSQIIERFFVKRAIAERMHKNSIA